MDVWSVILEKVDPSSIFKCILVSKEWLHLITSSGFRKQYLNKWIRLNVMGFVHIKEKFRLVAPNSLASQTKLWEKRFPFRVLSKSAPITPLTTGLMLCADPDLDTNLYVFNLATSENGVLAGTPLPPPPPPLHKYFPTTQIISFHDSSFKVVRVSMECHTVDSIPYRSIHTFCSSTWTWESSKLKCCDGFIPAWNPKIVSSKGVDYFPGTRGVTGSFALLARDTNNQTTRLILGPISRYKRNTAYYEGTPEGNLRCATTEFSRITIWNLDPRHFEWKPSFIFDAESAWEIANSVPAKESCYRLGKYPFTFVSFVPGRPDSIFVEMATWRLLFVYNVHTQALDKFEGKLLWGFDVSDDGVFLPLTMEELGVWPSSPSPTSHKKPLLDFIVSKRCIQAPSFIT